MIGPFSGLSDESIRIAIRNSTGARLALFVPDRAFEILVRQQVRILFRRKKNYLDDIVLHFPFLSIFNFLIALNHN
jgi:hypothetical protein